MRQSALFSQTLRENPHAESAKNAILLQRGGYIHKTVAGSYSFLPLGLIVLRKIAQIVREEMNKLPQTSEVQMTILQSKDLWVETSRWDDAGIKEVMYRLKNDDSVGLGPSHEENVTDIFRTFFSSYKDLPRAVYQIATKFRNEPRAKSGLLRGREFLMKDLYSFHTSQESLDQYYEEVAAAYLKTFQRMGLTAIRAEASGGIFSKQHSDEFQVLCPVGEDEIYLNQAGDFAWNQEVVEGDADPKLLEFSGGQIKKVRAVEVGNIFRLGTRYSEPMRATVTDESGQELPVLMGCYGIGISRLMGVIAELFGEQSEDGKGLRLVWPASVAPVQIHILDLLGDGQAEVLYQKLLDQGVEVLLDDREGLSAGEKFADADLVGAPQRVIVSRRSMEAGGIESKKWPLGEAAVMTIDNYLQNQSTN